MQSKKQTKDNFNIPVTISVTYYVTIIYTPNLYLYKFNHDPILTLANNNVVI